MATSANNLDTLNGLFKKVYADKIEDLIPDGVKVLKKMKFAKGTKHGESFNQPVILGYEHGMTFGGTSDDAFTLNAPVAGNILQAEVKGYPKVLRSVIGYTSLSRAAAGGEAAFKQSTKYVVANMLRSISKKQEIEALYGQEGYGEVDSVSGTTITLKTASFAPGIWAGGENMPVEIRNAAGTTVRGEASISSVDIGARTVTLNSMPSGVAQDDIIWHKGAYGKEAPGLKKLMTNSGTLHGISAADYTLWKGNTVSAGSAELTFGKVNEAIAEGVAKGLEGDTCLVVNPKTWADLLDDQAALRQYDSSYSSAQMENGAKSLKYHTQAGMTEVIPSIYCKEGDAFIFAEKDVARIGSTDTTFRLPDRNDEFFRHLSDSAGIEIRCWSDFTQFSSAPGKMVYINEIVN